jgi:hypothetical protein
MSGLLLHDQFSVQKFSAGLQAVVETISRREAVLRTVFTRRIMAMTKLCTSIPKTLYVTDSLRWI